MKKNELLTLTRLRLLVGYLGEQGEYKFWSSSFFSTSSSAFLTPVVGKTTFLAQYYGVKEAANRVHDNHIGVGRGVYHLFRLPEALEQAIHNLLYETEIVEQLISDLSNVPKALELINSYKDVNVKSAIGPIRIGGLDDISNIAIWNVVAKHYRNSIETKDIAYPFFSEG